MKTAFRKSCLLIVVSGLAVAGCRGAACGNCGAMGPGYGQYAQPMAPGTVIQAPPPGVVTPPPQIQPGAAYQPGVQYPPGTVPVAPQQLQPGSIYGG